MEFKINSIRNRITEDNVHLECNYVVFLAGRIGPTTVFVCIPKINENGDFQGKIFFMDSIQNCEGRICLQEKETMILRDGYTSWIEFDWTSI